MAEPSSNYIPVQCLFMAGGEVVRDYIHFAKWKTYRITSLEKNVLSVRAEDGSENLTIVGVTERWAIPQLRQFGVKVAD